MVQAWWAGYTASITQQYHMALWVAVTGQSSVSLKGRLELQIGGNIQATSVPENKADEDSFCVCQGNGMT